MEKVTIVTSLPKTVVKSLTQSRVAGKINTIPSIAEEAIDVIKEYFAENVGYENIPIAGLVKLNNKKLNLSGQNTELIESGTLPVKANDSMLLEFVVPADSVVTCDLQYILEISEEFGLVEDDDEREQIRQRLKRHLCVGMPDPDETEDLLSFIPFLDLSQCQHFAILDEDFNTDVMKWKTRDVNELKIFLKD